jgi:hypothetical protein
VVGDEGAVCVLNFPHRSIVYRSDDPDRNAREQLPDVLVCRSAYSVTLAGLLHLTPFNTRSVK